MRWPKAEITLCLKQPLVRKWSRPRMFLLYLPHTGCYNKIKSQGQSFMFTVIACTAAAIWRIFQVQQAVISHCCFDVTSPVIKTKDSLTIHLRNLNQFCSQFNSLSIALALDCRRRHYFTCCSLMLWVIVLCVTKWRIMEGPCVSQK